MIKYLSNLKIKISLRIAIVLVILAGAAIFSVRSAYYTEVYDQKDQVKTLLGYKTPYVGDNSKVGNIIGALNLPKGIKRNGIELKTEKPPFGIIINYDVEDDSEIFKDDQVHILPFYKNSAIIFGLVDNVDYIHMKLDNKGSLYQLEFNRQMLNDYFKIDVRNFCKDDISFKGFLDKLEFVDFENRLYKQSNALNIFNIYKADDQLTYLYKAGSYLVEDSSITQELPNIINSEYGIKIKKMTLDGTTMTVDLHKSMMEDLDKGSANAAYKLSVLYKSLLDRKNIRAVKVLIDGKEGIEGNHFSFKNSVTLESDGRTAVEKYFSIMPAIFTPKAYNYDKKNLEEVIKNEIIKRDSTAYKEGEVPSEGHKILRIDNVEGHTKVYLIASTGEFGFENGIFTKISGSGATPGVMTFSKNGRGEYMFEEYRLPGAGSEYTPSIKKMFPLDLQKDALNSQKYYDELKSQEEVYALEYLKMIKREAAVQANHVDKVLADINVDAANKLLGMYGEYPYWVGSLEKLENGQRYIYEKTFDDKGNGDGIVSFTKKKYTGELVERAVIEVKNGKMAYLEGQQRPEGYSKK